MRHHTPIDPRRLLSGPNLLFGVSLLLLVALGSWWFILHWSEVQTLHRVRLSELAAKARLQAVELGHRDLDPREQKAFDGPFEIVPAAETAEGLYSYVLTPKWPALALRTQAPALDELRRKHQRRRLMIFGEGVLLLLLIGVCILIFHRLLATEQRNRREMETFFQAVSHELKTPLAGVRALLETLAAHTVGEADIPRYARLGLTETARLQRLLENVLMANRLGRDVFSAHLREIKLVAETREFVERRNQIFPTQQSSFTSSGGDEATVQADPDLMRQVMHNLLDNAFKYSPADPEVAVAVTIAADTVSIEVSDRGIGFNESDKAALFEKFRRGNGETIGDARGYGLGLFIVPELLRSMGARLTAASDGPGRGSRFTITFNRD